VWSGKGKIPSSTVKIRYGIQERKEKNELLPTSEKPPYSVEHKDAQ
jgi:hypothetical protein